jgi:putative oxidoreductase
MDKDKISMKIPGMFFIRALLGIIFFMQGYGKIFTIGVGKVYDRFFKDFENTFLPKWLILSTAYYTSYVEMICGFLLIIGLFRKYAMYLLAVDLLIVSFGHGLMEPIWDLSHVIPRAILLATLFLLPAEWDKWNVDLMIKKRMQLRDEKNIRDHSIS